MKLSKAHFSTKVHSKLDIRFEDNRLTSFAGAIILQQFFQKMDLKQKFWQCFESLRKRSVVGFHNIFLTIIIMLMLGFRSLRDINRIKDDPIVLRSIGLKRMPDVTTISRRLNSINKKSIASLRALNRTFVLKAVDRINLKRITTDYDGSVISTKRHAEGTAIGYNKKKKGERSYYPLFCSIAQTGQILDFIHRPGNVHDSRDAIAFMGSCNAAIRRELGPIQIESRHDGAFFSDEFVDFWHEDDVLFTVSVPFERFSELKEIIEETRKWKKIDKETYIAELNWKPKCWADSCRMIAVKKIVRIQNKEPIQLELFTPHETGFTFKVIATNRKESAKTVIRIHEGRGYQEHIFGELKSQSQMDYTPVNRLYGNQAYLLASVFSHNSFRELQMISEKPDFSRDKNRIGLWAFKDANTLRQYVLQRAGRLTRPNGAFRLTFSGNRATKRDVLHYLRAIAAAA